MGKVDGVVDLTRIAAELKDKADRAKFLRQKGIELKDEIQTTEGHMVNLQQARDLVIEIADMQRSEVVDWISNVVQAAESILEEPYDFVMTFQPKRNRSECLLQLAERFDAQGDDQQQEPFEPIGNVGVGVIDIVSFALRVASLSLATNIRPVLIFDEPFKFVSEKYLERVGAIIQELEKLGIQSIFASHDPAFIAAADSVWRVFKENKKSKVMREY